MGRDPRLAKPSQLAMQIYVPTVPQLNADHALVSVGATSDPRYGCTVNHVESAGRLTRLHRASVVALTGEGDLPMIQEAVSHHHAQEVRG
jgi:hypothetical protein